MTTTAQSVSGLDVASTDAMDLHPDVGYDLGDEDIDFDMRSNNGYQTQEDDVLSLQDAAVDETVDMQKVAGSQDDFMIDNEIAIDEDGADNNRDLELADIGHVSSHDVDIVQDSTITEITITDADADADADIQLDNKYLEEDDIIDYSDDETQPRDAGIAEPVIQNTFGEEVPNADTKHGQSPVEVGSLAVESSAESEQGIVHEEHGITAGEQTVAVDQTVEAREGDWSGNPSLEVHETTHLENNQEDDIDQSHVSKEQDEGPLENHDVPIHSGDGNLGEVAEHDASQTENHAQPYSASDVSKSLHPITINYDGSELWLFKPSNDEDGEWLISDGEAATQPFPYLFHACRAQLGDDISNETELGIRFDHLHAMELFEDCTACAYTSLQDLVDVYLSLHAQDGNTKPDPFYVTLQFRPRVLTLVKELKKAVSENIGFSGLDAAIAAGQTSFKSGFSNNSGDAFDEDWVLEEQVTHEEDVEADEKISQVQEPLSHTPHSEESAGGSSASHAQDDSPRDAAEASTPGATSTVSNSKDASASGSIGANDDEEVDDIIDYSDEEEVANAVPTEQVSAHELSSSSSTVQGDDASDTNVDFDDFTNTAVQHEESGRSAHGAGDMENDAYPQYDEKELNDTLHVNDEAFGFTHALDSQGYSAPDDFQADSTYYYEEEGTTAFDQQDQIDLTGDIEHDDYSEAINEDDPTAVDDFLDLNAAPELEFDEALIASKHTVEEEITYEDEEGATGQDAYAASTAGIDPQGSPQGLKRPIDEVDAGSDDGASDISGWLSCGLHSYMLYADRICADAKRPKL